MSTENLFSHGQSRISTENNMFTRTVTDVHGGRGGFIFTRTVTDVHGGFIFTRTVTDVHGRRGGLII